MKVWIYNLIVGLSVALSAVKVCGFEKAKT